MQAQGELNSLVIEMTDWCSSRTSGPTMELLLLLQAKCMCLTVEAVECRKSPKLAGCGASKFPIYSRTPIQL